MTDSKNKIEESYRKFVRSYLNEDQIERDWDTYEPEGFDCHAGELIELNEFSDNDADAKHTTFLVIKDFNLRKMYKDALLKDAKSPFYGFVEYLVKHGFVKTHDKIFEIREDELPYVFEI